MEKKREKRARELWGKEEKDERGREEGETVGMKERSLFVLMKVQPEVLVNSSVYMQTCIY